jgi:choline kinase
VILAAGEGSRMGAQTEAVPKAFMALEGRTLFDRQRAVLGDHVDDVTVVLGYAADQVVDRVGSANVVIVEDWEQYDNAESLRRALAEIDDDVLVLNGDVVVAEAVVKGLLAHHSSVPPGTNVVGCIPGHQEGSTAIRVDDAGRVTDYGMITGHQHAGIGVVDRDNVDPAERYLQNHRQDWYPVVYPAFDTEMVAVDPGAHVEINRPDDLRAARRKFSQLATDEADA